MPAATASVWQPMGQGVISDFKSSYLINTFQKAIVTIGCDSFEGSGQSKQKTLWEGFTILNAIQNISDSWEKAKISTRIGVWKKVIATLMDDSGVHDFCGGSNCRCGAKSKSTRIISGPEDVTECLQSHDKS